MGKVILGAGVTGLAAGMASGLPVYEARNTPGGICCSYYMSGGSSNRLTMKPDDDQAYRFEIGGGHWIFGGDPAILSFIEQAVAVKQYERCSSVYFPDERLYVPYPIQNHLRYFDQSFAIAALSEMAEQIDSVTTLRQWLLGSFGSLLCEKFFFPFHELYTAGLYDRVAAQDTYKSPVDLKKVRQGLENDADSVGYNISYLNPADGLDSLSRYMASACDIHYGHTVVSIDVKRKVIGFENGSEREYTSMICTLPLNRMALMTGLARDDEYLPYVSVLVLNIGAKKGSACPKDHWIYCPNSQSGFHRVGFYSNVDDSFLPLSARAASNAVSIYVERAFVGGQKPDGDTIERYCRSVVRELQEWGYIGEVDVADPTWINEAYTYQMPGSQLKQQWIDDLAAHGIHMVGRYGRWVFQGIADSIRDGFFVGAALADR